MLAAKKVLSFVKIVKQLSSFTSSRAPNDSFLFYKITCEVVAESTLFNHGSYLNITKIYRNISLKLIFAWFLVLHDGQQGSIHPRPSSDMTIHGPHPIALFFLEAVRTKAFLFNLLIRISQVYLPAAESTLVVYLRMFGLYFVIEEGTNNAYFLCIFFFFNHRQL